MAGRQLGGKMPGWVKGFAVAGTVLLLVAIAMAALGHGPWQHMAIYE